MPSGNTFNATRPTLFFLPCLALGLRMSMVPRLIISTAQLFSRSRLVAKLKLMKAFARWSRIHKRRRKRHVTRPWSRGFFLSFFFLYLQSSLCAGLHFIYFKKTFSEMWVLIAYRLGNNWQQFVAFEILQRNQAIVWLTIFQRRAHKSISETFLSKIIIWQASTAFETDDWTKK